MNADQWQQFAAPVAPLTVNNPDRVVTVDAKGRTSTLFPAGPLQLNADQIVSYLQVRNPNESDLAHLNRKQAVWSAWLAAIKASSCTGRGTGGDDRRASVATCSGLSKGAADIATLPGEAQSAPGANDETFVADPAASGRAHRAGCAAADARERGRPRPRPVVERRRSDRQPERGRRRDRVCRWRGHRSSATPIASTTTRPRSSTTTTSSPPPRQKLRDALGLGEVIKSPTPNDIEDVTVILGRDATAKYGGSGG